MAKEKLTEAEKYRLERKKRIEKEKKKKNSYINRNRQKVEKAEKIVGIVVACIAVLAITFGLLDFFGVFNRTLTAVKVDDKNISVAVMNCAMADIRNRVYSASQEYEQSYGNGYYTSDTKLTDSCAYDSEKTWGEYFQEQAVDYVKQVYTYKDAKNNTLTEDQQKDINDAFDTLAENATQDEKNTYSLNAYIRLVYGKGVNKKVLRTWLEDVHKAENAQTALQNDYTNGITNADITKYYKEHKADYNIAKVMYYTITVDTSSHSKELSAENLTNEQIDKIIKSDVDKAKSQANSLVKKIQANPSKFVDVVNAYEKNVKQNNNALQEDSVTVNGVINKSMTSISENGRNWIASGATKNSVKAVYNADYDNKAFTFDIIRIIDPAKEYSTVNVRHILIQPEDTSDKASVAEAEETAKTLYAQWKKNPTEDYFSELAEKNSKDTGSTSNGGLYEDVYPGQMVQQFNDWCFDSSRKKGDSGIVKTDYGYHIMYFVSNNGVYWKTQVPKDMASDYTQNNVTGKLEKIKADKVSFGWNRIQLVKEYKKAQKETTTAAQTTAAADAK